MDDSPRQKLVSLDDLVAEVQALHSRVSQLERELARVRIETTIPRASGREPVEVWPHLHEVRPSDATPGTATPDSPVRQVLTADEDTAARHLERLRASITRLREERARAAAEFRMLTRPRAEGEASAPAEPPSEVATPEPAAVVPGSPLSAVAPPAVAAVTQETPGSQAAESAESRPDTNQPEPGGEPAEAASEPPAVPLAFAGAASPAPSPDHPGHAAPRGVDISTSFPTLAAARQALDEYAARLPSGAPAEPARPREAAAPEPPAEEAPDAEWRRMRALALDSELERNEIRRRRRLLRAVAMIGSVLLIGAAALALSQWLRSRGEEAPAAAANTATPALDARAQAPAAPPAAVPQPSTPAPPPPAATPSSGPVGTSGTGATPAPVPPRIELRTTREVWMRTSVDGQPFRERLVPGDQSLPFNPTTTFYVRAGDAGGVRIFIDGEDRGQLGPDGRVVTRNYPIAPRAEPVQPR